MLRTNVINKTRFYKSDVSDDRFARASAILAQFTTPKPKITIMHAALYSDNIRVDYFADAIQHHKKIMLMNLERFVLQTYKSRDLSDLNIYYFIDENLYDVCSAYIAAGKELTNA